MTPAPCELPSELSRRPLNTVAGHPVERHAVHRREQLPIKKARYATGAERGYLAKDTLSGAVSEPGVTGEPSDAS
jgi:hypothetical protein